jgi:hypothetical protein
VGTAARTNRSTRNSVWPNAHTAGTLIRPLSFRLQALDRRQLFLEAWRESCS